MYFRFIIHEKYIWRFWKGFVTTHRKRIKIGNRKMRKGIHVALVFHYVLWNYHRSQVKPPFMCKNNAFLYGVDDSGLPNILCNKIKKFSDFNSINMKDGSFLNFSTNILSRRLIILFNSHLSYLFVQLNFS